MKGFFLFLAGLVAGAAGLGAVAWFAAPGMMLAEERSTCDLQETVKRITERAKAEGWVVSGVKELDKSVKKHGGPQVGPVRLVELCEPHHAGKILGDDDARVVSAMMPCTIAVYEKADGSVWVGHMQPGLVGRMFGGVVSEVMAGPVAEAQERFLDAVR